MLATRKRHLQTVELLLKHGALVEKVDTVSVVFIISRLYMYFFMVSHTIKKYLTIIHVHRLRMEINIYTYQSELSYFEKSATSANGN